MLNNKKGTIIMDMDEVLVNISPALYRSIRLKWPRFSPFFKDLGPLSDKEIFNREEFEIIKWLIKDDVKEDPLIVAYLRSLLFTEFFNTDIYKNLTPTHFAQVTLMNDAFIENSAIDKVFILSRVVPGAKQMTDSKLAFINHFFPNKKIHPIFIEEGTKGEAINKHGIDFSLLVDDEIMNILSIVNEVDISGKEFLVPSMGYNKIHQSTLTLIRNKNATISTFIPEEQN